jgi:hypothetical protein
MSKLFRIEVIRGLKWDKQPASRVIKIQTLAASFLSATQVDQKRRNENRERRLIRVQPKERGKH